MSLFTKIAGVAAGVSTVAVLGVAIAQGQPPNPLIRDPAMGAGQQSIHLTPMGETGVLSWIGETPTATPTKEPEPVAAAPAPAPEPVAAAPAPEPATSAMGAAPADPEPMRVARADRN